MPTVRIIIVNWNGKEYIQDCLDAVYNQTYSDFEVFIVDNNSTDLSDILIETLYPDAKLIKSVKNLGFTGGNILGFEGCSTSFVVLLNNDTRPRKDWLENLVKEIESDKDIGICGSVMLRWGTNVVDTAGDGCTYAGVGFKKFEGLCYDELPEIIHTFGACAGAAIYRKEMLDEIGFLDDAFFMNLEDVDISFRARNFGWKITTAKYSLVEHKVSQSVNKVSELSYFNGCKNVEFVWYKNVRSSFLIIAIVEKTINLTLGLLNSLASRKRLILFLKAKITAWKMIAQGKVRRPSYDRAYTLPLSSELHRVLHIYRNRA